MTDPKHIEHTLNNGALIMLAQLLNLGGLLTDPKDLRHAGDVAEMSPLLELPKVPDLPEGVASNTLEALAHVRSFQRSGAHALPLKSAQRDAIRKLLKAGAEKGGMRPGPDTNCLLREFGVGDE
jgi:hypothetical protein